LEGNPMPQKKAGRRGILSVKMTGQEIITMAVNTIQNRLHEVERDSTDSSFDGLRYAHNQAMQAMLRQVYELLLDTNRTAVAPTLGVDEERPPEGVAHPPCRTKTPR